MPRIEPGATGIPLTEAGRRLWAEVEWWDYFGDDAKGMSLVDYIDAIEGEAIALERERITVAVEAAHSRRVHDYEEYRDAGWDSDRRTAGLREALGRLDAPLDWDRESPEDRLDRFVSDVRAIATADHTADRG